MGARLADAAIEMHELKKGGLWFCRMQVQVFEGSSRRAGWPDLTVQGNYHSPAPADPACMILGLTERA
jgi:hypothetical protein